jgi:hypothetical protein
MVLYLIGLGLYDEQDITLRGLAAVKGCERVYLEAYTSILLCDKVCCVCACCVAAGCAVCSCGAWCCCQWLST